MIKSLICRFQPFTKILLLIFLLVNSANGQSDTELFPGVLNIQPFTANVLEPKLGFLFHTGDNELRLDIGNSVDILSHSPSPDETFSFGADFFTYSQLRNTKNFHFPVDAIDYLFGFNFGYKKIDGDYAYGIRARLSHISAHFVDGHFDKNNYAWRGGFDPRVYSREFIELAPFVKFNKLRIYGILTYIYHVDPVELGKDSYQLGFDYFAPNLIGRNFSLFAGYDFKIEHLLDYEINHSVSTGVKWGKPHGKGISFYLHFYNGKSVHGEWYFKDVNYSAVGMNLDL